MGMFLFFHPELKVGENGITRPVVEEKRWYAATVTSVWPIQKPLVSVTSCEGFSHLRHSLSSGEQPIMKMPGDTQTYLSSSTVLILTFPGLGGMVAVCLSSCLWWKSGWAPKARQTKSAAEDTPRVLVEDKTSPPQIT